MASLRKKYQDRVESPDKPPVTVPIGPAKISPTAAETETRPVEIEQPDPVAEAEKHALKQRLAEVENAERLTREAVTQQQPPPQAAEPQQPTTEQIIASSGLPEQVQDWLRQYPEFVTDPVKNAQMQRMHFVAEHQAGEAFTAPYLERMEVLLGLKQEAKSNGQSGPVQINRPQQPQRYEAPVRQQRPAGPPVSAPPTRASPSMTTGRPVTGRQPLTEAQRDAARASGISEEEYARQLEKMNQMKAAGMLQDGR
jgi:hypothetical protein